MAMSLKPAACVLLYRRRDNKTELYIARRADSLPFLGGFDVLPGGRVDTHDHALSLSLPDGEFRAAAVRELFEEVGVLAASGAEVLTPTERHSLRERVLSQASDWPQLLATHNLSLDLQALMPIGRWTTPPYMPMRFDAIYYALEMPPEQEPHILPGELVQGAWYTPTDALERHQRGELYITFPLLETLRYWVNAGLALDKAAAALASRGSAAYPHAGGEMLAGLHMIPLKTPTLPPATHTNTYVLGGKDLVVVDPSPIDPDEQQALASYLDYLQSQGGTLKEIWLTHHHTDHVGAVRFIQERYRVPIAADAGCATMLRDEFKVDRILRDGDTTALSLGDGRTATWMALATPGHCSGHMAFYDTTLGTVVAGDLIAGMGTILVAPPDGHMQTYLQSLRRLLGMKLGFIFPSHGPPVASAARKIQEYINHRLVREEAIIKALASESLDVDALVLAVYTDTPASAYPLAAMNVRAHLEKLHEEGRVQEADGSYSLSAVSG